MRAHSFCILLNSLRAFCLRSVERSCLDVCFKSYSSVIVKVERFWDFKTTGLFQSLCLCLRLTMLWQRLAIWLIWTTAVASAARCRTDERLEGGGCISCPDCQGGGMFKNETVSTIRLYYI